MVNPPLSEALPGASSCTRWRITSGIGDEKASRARPLLSLHAVQGALSRQATASAARRPRPGVRSTVQPTTNRQSAARRRRAWRDRRKRSVSSADASLLGIQETLGRTLQPQPSSSVRERTGRERHVKPHSLLSARRSKLFVAARVSTLVCLAGEVLFPPRDTQSPAAYSARAPRIGDRTLLRGSGSCPALSRSRR